MAARPTTCLTLTTPAPTATVPSHRSNASAPLSVSYLNQNHQTLTFGKLDSDYHVHSRALQIDNVVSIPTLVHEILSSIVTVEIGMTNEEITYVTQVLLLKRVQDIYRRAYAARPPNMITLPRIALIPGPIHDLLNSIGTFHSKVTGVNYISVPPQRLQPVPNYWEVNLQIFRRFNLLMSRMQHQYTMRSFPSLTDTEDRPLILTELSSYDDLEDEVFVKSWTNEPRPSDALMRSVCDDIYEADNLINYDNCKLTMSQRIVKPAIIAEYVGSYVNESNS